MPRRKMNQPTKAKGKKVTSTKRQIKSPSLTLAENIEKDFRHVPAKLAALYSKDLTATKQKEKKMQTELNKAKVQMKMAKDKHTTLTTKSKTSAVAKKQLNTTKKSLDTLNTTITKLLAELDQCKSHGKMLTLKQVKFTTLGKQLVKFEKEFDIKQKQAATVKPRKKATRKDIQPHKEQPFNDTTSETPELPTTSVSRNELVELES